MKLLFTLFLTVTCLLVGIARSNAQDQFVIENVRTLNSPRHDYCPRILDIDGTKIAFASRRGSINGKSDNLYYAERESESWKISDQLMESESGVNYGVLTMDKKRNVAFYTRCQRIIGVSKKPACNIYYSFLTGDMIGEPIELDLYSDTIGDTGAKNIGHPYFSAKHNALIFAADYPSGYGGTDIWFSIYNPTLDIWSRPINAGPTINSPEPELFPSIRPNGEIYFASRGHNSMGGLDLFKAPLFNHTGPLDSIVIQNLGPSINTEWDDFSLEFDDTGISGYFSSNRPGGLGEDDIYSFKVIPNASIPTPEQLDSTSSKDELEGLTDEPDDTLETQVDSTFEALNSEELITGLKAMMKVEDCLLPTSIPEIQALNIFPNPNQGRFQTSFNISCNANLVIRVFNTIGQIVHLDKVSAKAGENLLDFNLGSQAPGVNYFQILYDCHVLKSERMVRN